MAITSRVLPLPLRDTHRRGNEENKQIKSELLRIYCQLITTSMPNIKLTLS